MLPKARFLAARFIFYHAQSMAETTTMSDKNIIMTGNCLRLQVHADMYSQNNIRYHCISVMVLKHLTTRALLAPSVQAGDREKTCGGH